MIREYRERRRERKEASRQLDREVRDGVIDSLLDMTDEQRDRAFAWLAVFGILMVMVGVVTSVFATNLGDMFAERHEYCCPGVLRFVQIEAIANYVLGLVIGLGGLWVTRTLVRAIRTAFDRRKAIRGWRKV